MRRLPISILVSVSLLLIYVSAQASTLSISPASPTATVGQTVQFTAQVTDLTPTDVTWSAGGKIGGNSTAGTISTTGLYQAPTAIPAQDPVQIIATSKASSTVRAIVYVYLVAVGPTITSVSPNPIPLGNFNVTVQGSGFQQYAEVFEQYGSNLIALSTVSQTATTIVANGWQGAATSASFFVKNPGSSYGNAITVPVGAPPTLTHTLSVVNGTGSGTYAAGKSVTIVANAPPTGRTFKSWTGAPVANAAASTTTLTMPATNTSVTATYSEPVATKYALTVNGGTGSGTYAAGSVVTITANSAPGGQQFSGWTGATVASPASPTTTITMPAAAAVVTANYSPVSTTTYPLTVVGGSGSGAYAPGTVVTIVANAPPSGQQFSGWSGSAVASATSATTTIAMPASPTTVTANYVSTGTVTFSLDVVNGSGTGSYAAGTVVTITANAAPSGQAFSGWTGFAVKSPTSMTTTLTIPSYGVTVTANDLPISTSTIPFPVTSHPRLWITQADLPRLQSWATAANPVYQQGMVPLLQQAVSLYNAQFFPGGVANTNYPDPGDTQGYTGTLSEEVGIILALNSLVDPSLANRITYAQDARNLVMYAMSQAALGHLAGAPFRDPMFAVYNRANFSGEQWPLIVDWIYNTTDAQGNPILTTSDKATIRKVFLMWANDCINASTTGGDHPSPIGVTNSSQLLPGNLPYRMASNNYYLGHARLLTMMGLCLDPSDDLPVNAALPASQMGNTMRSYILNANGAWLYQEYAMMGDPATVANAYGYPGIGAGFGLASGGLPPEGMLYGHSFGFVLGQLLALQTAGFNNPAYTGPQAGLIGAPVWDRFVQGYLSSLVPAAQVPPSQPYLGPVYELASYGDLLRLWVTPDMIQPFALLALMDRNNGKTSNVNAARWMAVNGLEGGANYLNSRISQPWSYGVANSILYFLLMDPSLPAPTDPRPAMPTTFYDPGAGRILAHSDWGAQSTMFDYRASWESINHQDADGGQFELYRKGEWLTKEMSNYDNNGLGQSSPYHNAMGLQNWCANGIPNLNWYENGEWADGSQWILGLNNGDPTTAMSSSSNYVYAASDLTNLYNRPNFWTPADGAMDIAKATRSILWLNNDYIVVYDRATSVHSGLFKRFNLELVTNPAITGNIATETTPTGQQLFIQTLLPQAPSIAAANVTGNLSSIAQLEPTQFQLTVQDPTNPTDTRFLHVLQGADAGAAMVPATHVASTFGTAFDGAAFGSTVVYFPVSAGSSFAGTTLPVPAGTHTAMVTGLAPNTAYGFTIQGGAITVTPGALGNTTDAAGMLTLTF